MTVVVVGDLVADVVVRPAQAPAVDSDTPARVLVRGGGSAANTAAWLATQGVDVLLAARVGDDLLADLLEAELREAGVRTALTRDRERPTGSIVVLVESDGRRTMLTDRGAADALAPDDLPPLDEAAHLHLSGYTLLGEGSRAAGLAALERAAALGVPVSVTPGTAAPLRAAGASAFLDWTSNAASCIANREEAAILTGVETAGADPAQLARGLAAHYTHAVVTLGPDGALWAGDGEVAHAAAAPAGVRDTTGAGDACAAGFLAATLGGAEPHVALARGVALAARAVAVSGGRPPRDDAR